MKITCAKEYLKKALFVSLLITISNIASAQSQETLIRASVDQLFDGMRSGDSSALRNVFQPQSILTSIAVNAKDSVVSHQGKTEEFIAAVGKPHPKKWDERIYDVKISVDGPMAIVWAPYKFYLGDTFSHCGVNVFTMIKTAQGWKISAITDTRRKADCL